MPTTWTRVRPSGMSMIHFIFAFGFGLTISATCNIFAMLVCQTSSSGYVQRIKQPLNAFLCCNLHMHYNRHTVHRQQHWYAISSGGFLGPLDGLLHGRTELSACCNESPWHREHIAPKSNVPSVAKSHLQSLSPFTALA